ncbi:hypothetical protein TKK_0002584 [Trichogramma kaykai]|uniref:non-specific serine/threonine protein kinase n=1 Tax=Trichogramma kaykai TaxID=54128 RepID=A0ABD2WZ81_9HYME
MSDKVKVEFIYELPYSERLEVCRFLNQNNKWEELAGNCMQFTHTEIEQLKRESNPADELLTAWGHLNHTILELFVLLSKVHNYEAMRPLKKFVDSKYHPLILIGESNLSAFFNGKVLDNLKQNNNIIKKLIDFSDEVNDNEQNKNKNINDLVSKETPPCKPKETPHCTPKETPYCTPQETSKETPNLKKSNEEDKILNIPKKNTNESILNSMKGNLDTHLPRIPYEELAKATQNWNRANLLGSGGFGVVFKGIWKNTEVAIKKIEPKGADLADKYALQLEQSFREIKILNSSPHENILPLYAYSLDGFSPCLVYQLMQNGSLEDRLRRKNDSTPLTWIQRREIAKGVARGLQYLHTLHSNPLIHGDIKSANILLDKNMEPKIGDFGLAREGSSDDSFKVSKVQGTRPYLPDDYIIGKNLSTKIDTYSFGIVLFELATGLAAYDSSRPSNKLLKEYIDSFTIKRLELIHDHRAGDKLRGIAHYLIILGKWCTNKSAHDRPEMSEVYAKFKS